MWTDRDWIIAKNQVNVARTWKTGNSRKPRAKPRPSICKVILKYCKFYCQYSSLAGIKYLASSRNWFER